MIPVWPKYVFTLLCLSFLAFSFYVYNIKRPDVPATDVSRARQGRLLWQKLNCQSCHQLFGLGGYLGPDLSNVYSKRGEKYIRSFLKSGTQQMPAFHLSENEIGLLIEFLRSVDECGNADPRSFTIQADGMIRNHDNRN